MCVNKRGFCPPQGCFIYPLTRDWGLGLIPPGLHARPLAQDDEECVPRWTLIGRSSGLCVSTWHLMLYQLQRCVIKLGHFRVSQHVFPWGLCIVTWKEMCTDQWRTDLPRQSSVECLALTHHHVAESKKPLLPIFTSPWQRCSSSPLPRRARYWKDSYTVLELEMSSSVFTLGIYFPSACTSKHWLVQVMYYSCHSGFIPLVLPALVFSPRDTVMPGAFGILWPRFTMIHICGRDFCCLVDLFMLLLPVGMI